MTANAFGAPAPANIDHNALNEEGFCFGGKRPHYAQERRARLKFRHTYLVAAALILALSDRVLAAVPIMITNDDTGALYVTVLDRSQHPPVAILSAQRINGLASISITVSANSAGYARLNWSARNADRFFHRCGNGRRRLGANATLHVNATRRCPSKLVQ
jgi:hypothetical protein